MIVNVLILITSFIIWCFAPLSDLALWAKVTTFLVMIIFYLVFSQVAFNHYPILFKSSGVVFKNPIDSFQKGEEKLISRGLEQPTKPQPTIKFVLTSAKATPPERGTLKSAGYDLKSSEDCIVVARSRKAIKTNVKVVLPSNTYGRIASRSGLSFKNGIEVGAGVVDEDYQNDLMVILHNHSDVDFLVKEKDRIAQFIVENVVYPTTHIEDINGVVQTTNKCIRNVRGSGGFGSTGTS